MKHPVYCEECGRKLIPYPGKRFFADSGKRRFGLRCPKSNWFNTHTELHAVFTEEELTSHEPL